MYLQSHRGLLVVHMKFPLFGTKESKHYVYAVAISPGVALAAVWHIDGEQILVDQVSDLIVWDTSNEESLLEAVDTAIASFPDHLSASEVLFALPDDWVTGLGITTSRKPVLKAITQKLELHSVGFVVTLEAIIAKLRDSSSHPLHAVCVFVEEQAFVTAVIRHNQSSNLIRVGRSGQTVQDLIEGFSRLKTGDLPTQIVLSSLCADEDELVQIAQELTNHTWEPSWFAQLPKIQSIDADQIILAVAQTGGKEVGKALGLFSEGKSNSVHTPIAPPQFEPIVLDSHNPSTEQTEASVVEDEVSTQRRKLPSFSFPKNKFAPIIGLVAVLVLGALLGFFVIIPRMISAQVTLVLKEYDVTSQATVTLDPLTDSPAEDILPAEMTSAQITADKEVPATGKKTIGDKAKGTVTIYNKTSQSKKFPAGTQLKTGKLSFVTDEETTVASASSTISETVHGKSTIKATAAEYGEASNIDKNVEMNVGSFDKSAFVARSESPFTGGNSKQTTAVAQKDHDDALKAAIVDMKAQAGDAIRSKANNVQEVVVLDDVVVTNKKYSAAVGAEASSVSVSATASASGILYTKAQLTNFAQEKLNAVLPAGSSLLADTIKTEITGQKVESKQKIQLSLALSSKAKPSLEPTQYTKILAGKNLEESRHFLDTQEAIASYTLTVRPVFLAIFSKSLPKDAARISISVQ